jgi:hypothetical protein
MYFKNSKKTIKKHFKTKYLDENKCEKSYKFYFEILDTSSITLYRLHSSILICIYLFIDRSKQKLICVSLMSLKIQSSTLPILFSNEITKV